MATVLKLKRSGVNNKIPAIGDLEYGEIAINYADGKIFLKNINNNVIDTSKQIFDDTTSVIANTDIDPDLSSIQLNVNGTEKISVTAAGITFSGPLTLNGAETFTLFDNANNKYIAIQAPDTIEQNYILKLPSEQPIDFSLLGNDGRGNTTWSKTDFFGGNRVFASDKYGDDLNDGVNAPVKTIKRACQIAASLGQIPNVDPGTEAYNAKRLLEDNRTYIQKETIEFIEYNFVYFNNYFDTVKCERDTGLIIDAVTYDFALGTNYNSVTAGLSYKRANASTNQTYQNIQTLGSINFVKSEVNGYLTANPTAQAASDANFDIITNIIENDIIAALNFPSASGTTTNQYNAMLQLVANRTFAQEEIIAYINQEYPTLNYDSAKCYRDVGYLIDALCYDIMYGNNGSTISGGNSASVTAAQSYYVGGVSQLGQNEATATADAYDYLSVVLGQVILADSNWSPISTATLQDTSNPASTATEVSLAAALLQIVEDAITAGNPNSIPTLVQAPVSNEPLYSSFNIVQNLRGTLISATINFITTTYNNLTYNAAKCERDVGLIVDAVVFDLILGGNEKSVEAGESYLTVSVVINNQKTATVESIKFIRDLSISIINSADHPAKYQNIVQQVKYPALTTSTTETDILALYNIIVNILDTETAYAGTVTEASFRTIPVTVNVASGDFYVDNPIIIPDLVSVVGDSLRAVVIRPLNANKDMFRVRNGAYLTGITFRDGLDNDLRPDYTFDFAVAFDDPTDTSVDRTGYFGLSKEKPTITLSPYIQNSSIISFLGGNGVKVDGSKVVTPNIPQFADEAEFPVDLTDGVPEQGKSMVANAFTMVSFGGTGWLVTNDGYAQIVSCFQIFCLNGSYCQSGGYLSITNSATNFGYFALRATGYSQNSFTFDRGLIANIGTSNGVFTITTIGTGRRVIEQFVIRIKDATTNLDITSNFKAAQPIKTFDAAVDIDATLNQITIVSHGILDSTPAQYSNDGNIDIPGLVDQAIYYIKSIDDDTIELYNDESLLAQIDIQAVGVGNHKFYLFPEEFYVDRMIEYHNNYQTLNLDPGTYSFSPGDSIVGETDGFENNAYVYSFNSSTNVLVVSVEYSIINELQQRVFWSSTSSITSINGSSSNIGVSGVASRTDLWTSQFQIQSTVEGNTFLQYAQALLQKINFHRPSIVNSSAHTWEYAGSGIDYNALPQNGGLGRGASFEQISELPGRVYSSGTNELGDFKVGDFIVAENKSGNIIFRTEVQITTLAVLKLSLSDVEVDAISTDVNLGDNEPGGALNSRLSTQLAVRSFFANRLGDVLDKTASSNAVPGAIVLLNSQGQINGDLLPPSRGVTTYNVDSYEGRLTLWNSVPVVEILSGDNASETYDQIELTLTGATTLTKGDTLIQDVSGASGIVKESINGTTLILLEPTGTFDTTNVLTLSGSSVGASSVPTVVGTVTTIVENYFLNNDNTNQFLVLDPSQSYNFSTTVSVIGAVSGAQGNLVNGPTGTGSVSKLRTGILYTLNITNGGSGYSNGGNTIVYNAVLYGNGTSDTLGNVTVSNGVITNIDIVDAKEYWTVGDTITVSNADFSGTGSGFAGVVTTIQNRLFLELTGSYIKFSPTATIPDYIADASSPTFQVTQTGSILKSFDAADIAQSGDVDYANNYINITAHGFADGDPVRYSNGGNLTITGLTNNTTYFVKVITTDSIELYTNYAFTAGTAVALSGSSTGSHNLTRFEINEDENRIVEPNHGLTVGTPVRLTTTSTMPGGLNDYTAYWIGSVTTNSFSLHNNIADATSSVNGVTTSAIDITSQVTGTLAVRVQNIKVIGAYNYSSAISTNWSGIAQSTIDASNIVSGVITTSRLAAAGSASNKTFLRGDSSWQYALQNIRPNTDSPITFTGDYFTTSNVNYYYNSLVIDITRASDQASNPTDNTYSSEGLSSFLKSQFTVTNGKVSVKTGVIDAGLLGGFSAAYFLDPTNNSAAIGISQGGTGLTTYTKGDLIYSGSNNSLTQLNIGASDTVLVSDGLIPGWSNTISLGGTGAGMTILGNTVWHAGNDGSGSGLDADTIDGLDSASFIRSDADDTSTGLLTLNRNNDEQLRIQTQSTTGSPFISFYQNSTRRAYIQYVNNSSLRLFNDRTDEYLDINDGINGLQYTAGGAAYTVWHSGNDGPSSTLDADTLDGKHFPAYGTSVSGADNYDVRVGTLWFYKNSQDSGKPATGSAHAYALYQEGGAWSTPYPDLRINYHTGIKIGANANYNGVRFTTDYNSDTVVFQVNGASGYNYSNTWLTFGAQGLYSNTNGAHWHPNTTTPYAPWRMIGSRTSYGGFLDSYSYMHYMGDSGGNGGIYFNNNSTSQWYLYHHRSNNCTSINTSTGSSSYGLYVDKTIYSTADITAYSDARLKENIVTIDDALNIVLKLKGVYYNRKDDETKTRKVGVIAQDVEKILPEVVTYAEDIDQYGVDYGKMAGVFIEAIKTQQQKIDKLENEVIELKDLVNKLLDRIK